MNAEEYANMERQEDAHWYYAGKRDIARGWLQRVGPPRADDLLLDCGAGTGRFAQEMQVHCRVLVLDDHEEALRLLRTKFRPDQILSLAGDRVPLPDASLDYVTALDVLEHTRDDHAVVASFHRLLKPGGVALVTVPAGMALWSDWDVALHHFRRYSRPQLRALFPADNVAGRAGASRRSGAGPAVERPVARFFCEARILADAVSLRGQPSLGGAETVAGSS
jgi:SAM-dependent methyltransferase